MGQNPWLISQERWAYTESRNNRRMIDKEPYNIKTEEDFSRVLEQIDQEMRNDNIPITARQIKGFLKFSSRFGLGLSMSDPLARKVMAWFEVRYGNKLNVDYSTGEMAISIRGDLFKVRFPFIGGKVQVICDPRFWMPNPGTQIAKDGNDPLPVFNLLNCIEGLTEDYALTLSLEEQKELTRLFLFGWQATQSICHIKNIPFIEEAKGDIAASISHLFEQRPQYGLSKWASLQAVEKTIKAFIRHKGQTPPFGHDLQALATRAEALGLPALQSTELAKVQCSAGVRYGQPTVTKMEALEAHHSAIRLCAEIANQLR